MVTLDDVTSVQMHPALATDRDLSKASVKFA